MLLLKKFNINLILSFIQNLGFLLILIYLLNFKLIYFFSGVFIGLLFYIIQLWRIENSYRNDLQLSLPVFRITERTNHFMLHYFVPALLYLSVCSYIFFSRLLIVQIFVVTLFCFAKLIIFTNLKAFFTNKYLIEIKTHYIYDLISLSSYLLFVLSSFEINNYLGLHSSVTYILNFLIGIIYFLTAVIRYRSNNKVLTLIIFSILNITAVIALTTFGFNILRIAGIQMYILYLLLIYLHHINESRSLRIRLLVEYLLIGMLILIIGYNI